MEPQKKIAVVGGGVAGIVSAHLLQRNAEVTLYEKNDYVGGHTNTVVIDSGPDEGLAVDTGFIVLNDKTYPNMHRFLKDLDVPVRWSDMSFSYECERSGLQYAGTNLSGLFTQRTNIVNPTFLKFLAELVRFCRGAERQLNNGGIAGLTLGEYLREGKFSRQLSDDYLLPIGSAIWSSPREEVSNFPAEVFIKFFSNHGLLSLINRPRWQTVVGGSQSYVRRFLERFRGAVRRETPVAGISREEASVSIADANGGCERYDAVVIAAHADEALRMLNDPSEDERRLLGAWRYEKNRTVLHTDASVLPAKRRARASWNYLRERESKEGAPASVTYHMNRLQGLKSSSEYCVTLNRTKGFDENLLLKECIYTHPSYTLESVKTQSALPQLNGQRRTYFCGSYFGYGFHEDAIRSALQVAEHFGQYL